MLAPARASSVKSDESVVQTIYKFVGGPRYFLLSINDSLRRKHQQWRCAAMRVEGGISECLRQRLARKFQLTKNKF